MVLNPKSFDHQYDYCGDPDASKEIKDCTDNYLDQAGLNKLWDTQCYNKTECALDVQKFIKRDGADGKKTDCNLGFPRAYV